MLLFIIILMSLFCGVFCNTLPTDKSPSPQHLHHNNLHWNSQQSEDHFNKWLAEYKAPDLKNQDFCLNILTKKESNANSGSQYSQDLFLFFNVFKYWPMNNRKGFYVDSGANDPLKFSNTYFYDVCLGWSGLCIEPEEQYHKDIAEKRSCMLVKECISDVEKNVTMKHDGVSSEVSKEGGTTKCSPLNNMLLKHPISAKTKHIDLWSLDVEGYEMTVLNTINFNEIDISVIMAEEFWSSTRNLDRKLNENGYSKYIQLPIDAVYVQRDLSVNTKLWLPKDHSESWQSTLGYRETVRAKLGKS